MAFTGRVISTWRGDYTKSADVGSVAQEFDRSVSIDYANGVGANQGNVFFADTRTLAASATEDLDLSGVLADVFGATVTQARVKAIRISAAAANTNNVIVGAASGTQWASLLNAAGTITLHPGAYFEAATPTAAGWAVTGGSADLLKIANSGGTTGVDYTIELIGGAT